MHTVSKVSALVSPGILFLKNGWWKKIIFYLSPLISLLSPQVPIKSLSGIHINSQNLNIKKEIRSM